MYLGTHTVSMCSKMYLYVLFIVGALCSIIVVVVVVLVIENQAETVCLKYPNI